MSLFLSSLLTCSLPPPFKCPLFFTLSLSYLLSSLCACPSLRFSVPPNPPPSPLVFLILCMCLCHVVECPLWPLQYVQYIEKTLWSAYWIGLGILFLVGLGTGYHTFLLYQVSRCLFVYVHDSLLQLQLLSRWSCKLALACFVTAET